MDSWFDKEVRRLLANLAWNISKEIGEKYNNILALDQPIREETLTTKLIEMLHDQSNYSLWGKIKPKLKEKGINIDVTVNESKFEPKTGADIGLIIYKDIQGETKSTYATLIQCKKSGEKGTFREFFHKVGNSGPSQSTLLLDLTPSSFYFLFVPSKAMQPLNQSNRYAFPGPFPRYFSEPPVYKNVGGVFVVPALSVESYLNNSKNARVSELLPNAFPFHLWFSELLLLAFVGDRNKKTVKVAKNELTKEETEEIKGVKYSVEVEINAENSTPNGKGGLEGF
ncbi:hypothetical protein K9M78_00805 [Candidatus Bipolaricaulota bacterium]|nr:hypothetical protein [Candidatus Bipolaricaulota bacterium]